MVMHMNFSAGLADMVVFVGLVERTRGMLTSVRLSACGCAVCQAGGQPLAGQHLLAAELVPQEV